MDDLLTKTTEAQLQAVCYVDDLMIDVSDPFLVLLTGVMQEVLRRVEVESCCRTSLACNPGKLEVMVCTRKYK